MFQNNFKLAVLVFVLSGLILTACGSGTPPTPTTDPNLIITQVAQTIEANLALTASAQPTQTYTPEPTQTPAVTVTPAITVLQLEPKEFQRFHSLRFPVAVRGLARMPWHFPPM